jgi:hypothetical protein
MAFSLLPYQQALQDWAQEWTGLRIVWDDEPRPDVRGGAALTYGILDGPLSLESAGTPDIELVQVDPGTAYPRPRGRKVCVFSLRVVSQSQRASLKAATYLNRAEMALWLPQTSKAFNLVGMSFARTEYGPPMKVASPQTDRHDSVQTMLITVNILLDSLMGALDAGSIETVQVSSTGLHPPFDEETFP